MKLNARYFQAAPHLQQRTIERVSDLTSKDGVVRMEVHLGIKKMGTEQTQLTIETLKQRLHRAPKYGEFLAEVMSIMVHSLESADPETIAKVEQGYRLKQQASNYSPPKFGS